MTVCLHCEAGIVRHDDGVHRSLGWEIACPFIHGQGNDYHDHHPLSASAIAASQNIAERDPSVMPDSAGADTSISSGVRESKS